YGLVILIADDAELKKQMTRIFEDDIFNNQSSSIVNKTSKDLSANYKIQAHPREINLFYLADGLRDRILSVNGEFRVNAGLKFSKDDLKKEINDHPERFSPNVILRALFQEMILPDVAFIGGGGELAYWLELKDLFVHYNIPFPVLILRNSFAIINRQSNE